MINREFQTVNVRKFLEIQDLYGQPRKEYIDYGTEEMVIKFFSGVLAPNPGYEDIDYICLTTNRELDSTYLINMNNKNYRIINVIPSRKFNQLFIRETNENPSQAKLPSPYDLTYEEDEIYYKFTWTSDVDVKYFTLELYKSDNTLIGKYEHLSFPRFFIPKSVMTLNPGDYKFRVKSLNPDSGYADSDWSEWKTFTILIPLDVPTGLKYFDMGQAYLFRWTAVEYASRYRMELEKSNGVLVGEYTSDNNQFSLLQSVVTLPIGYYQFRVKALAEEGSEYCNSEYSDWKEFFISRA